MAIAEELQAGLLAAGADALGISMSEAQTSRFLRYYAELVNWNERVNLTAITDWETAQVRHFVDSLTATQALSPEMLQTGSFIDVGSGGGFPGIPMKLAFPGMRGVLLDATAKKTAFLARMREVLDLQGLTVCTGRAEILARDSQMREAFDIAFARAVAEVGSLAELTLPFVRVGGVVVMHKKANIEDELKRGRNAIETLGGRLCDVLPVTLVGLNDRTIVVLEKVCPTPDRYPRRPGMPAKRPIGYRRQS